MVHVRVPEELVLLRALLAVLRQLAAEQARVNGHPQRILRLGPEQLGDLRLAHQHLLVAGREEAGVADQQARAFPVMSFPTIRRGKPRLEAALRLIWRWRGAAYQSWRWRVSWRCRVRWPGPVGGACGRSLWAAALYKVRRGAALAHGFVKSRVCSLPSMMRGEESMAW